MSKTLIVYRLQPKHLRLIVLKPKALLAKHYLLLPILVSLLLVLVPLEAEAETSIEEDIEQEIFERVNIKRESEGLEPLRYSAELARMARYHSQHMQELGFFSHKDKDGRTVGDRKELLVPELIGVVGENIGYMENPARSGHAKQFMAEWMKSSGHRENILRKTFNYLGVGVIKSGDVYHATQVFGQLIAVLDTKLPEKLAFNSELELTFRYLGGVPKNQLSVYVHFPDKKAVFDVGNGYFYVGHGTYKPTWDDDRFSALITFDKGRGDYVLTLAYRQTYFPEGIKVRVE